MNENKSENRFKNLKYTKPSIENDELLPKKQETPANISKDDIVGQSAYDTYVEAEVPRGSEKSVLSNGTEVDTNMGAMPFSQFSDYHLLRLKTLNGGNYPVKNSDKKKSENKTLYEELTARKLIDNPNGASIFKAEDFLFVERFKKIPLNRLITLRRFAHPVVDDIFDIVPNYDEPDICRMLTFSDQETNKLSDIMGFSCGMRWKPLESSMEAMQMHGASSGVSGYMSSVMKLADPTFGKDAIKGDTALTLDPMHDSNKAYGLVDSISSSHIRNTGLDFEQDIKLTFNFKMRSYNGVNGKSAFMDIISNILLMATNDAKFWGGSRFWLGRRPTKYMKNLKFLSPTSFNDFLNKAHVEFKGFMGKGSGDSKADALKMLKKVAENVFNLGFGKILDKVGRPAIPFTNSLVSGSPVGNWHVTVGNPLNPSMVMGNLILMGTTITFGDILGHDDFPEDIKVECTLKHAMPRGRAEIEQMFQAGKGRMYFKPKDFYNEFNKGGIQTMTEAKSNKHFKFGLFDKASVIRNAEEMYSFAQRTKEEQDRTSRDSSRINANKSKKVKK